MEIGSKLYKNKIRITSAQDVRRFLVRVCSRLDAGEINTQETLKGDISDFISEAGGYI